MRRAAGFLLLVSTLVFTPARAQDWTVVPLGTTSTLRDIAPTLFGYWVVGDGGFAAKSATSNDLNSWEVRNVLTDADLLSAIEVSGGQLWLSGAGGVVRLVLTNQFVVYTDRNIPDTSQGFRLFTLDSGRAVAIGSAGGCYRSDNLGQSWYSLPTGTDSGLHRGLGFVAGPAHAVGEDGVILYLNASVWSARNSGITATLHGLASISGALTAVGAGGTIVQSADGGSTWTVRDTPTTATLRAVSSAAGSSLAVGDGGTVLKSTDAGATWCRLDAGTTADLYACKVLSNDVYLAAGEGGLLLRTSTGGGECSPVGVAADILTDGFLSTPFPNPLQTQGQVRFQAPRDSRYRLQIFDLRGRRVAEVFTGTVAAGEQRTVGLEVADLPAGVYYLRLSGGARTSTQRFTVLR